MTSYIITKAATEYTLTCATREAAIAALSATKMGRQVTELDNGKLLCAGEVYEVEVTSAPVGVSVKAWRKAQQTAPAQPRRSAEFAANSRQYGRSYAVEHEDEVALSRRGRRG